MQRMPAVRHDGEAVALPSRFLEEMDAVRENRAFMRITKLVGILLLVCGVFVFTRGTGWHLSYMPLGVAIGFAGLLLVSRRPTRRWTFPEISRTRSAVRARTKPA